MQHHLILFIAYVQLATKRISVSPNPKPEGVPDFLMWFVYRVLPRIVLATVYELASKLLMYEEELNSWVLNQSQRDRRVDSRKSALQQRIALSKEVDENRQEHRKRLDDERAICSILNALVFYRKASLVNLMIDERHQVFTYKRKIEIICRVLHESHHSLE